MAGGRLRFDVEKGQGLEPSSQVNGRFTHSLAAIERALLPAGFAFSRVEQTPMRVEGEKPVLGLYCLARRGSERAG